jgi:hypothetical protein
MKLRKSKSDRLFRIDYTRRRPSANLAVPSKVRIATASAIVVAHNRAAAVKGFLWGMDRNNITINRCVCCVHLEPNL